MPFTKESSASSSSSSSPHLDNNNISVDIENDNIISNRRASWPSSSSSSTTRQQQGQNNERRTQVADEEEDPLWLRWKGAIGQQLGNIETSIGSMVGLNGLENNGRQWKEWGSHTIEHANTLAEQGAPSRIDGEYNRALGFIGKTVGHIIGDEEMEYNNSRRICEANEEIVQARKKSLE
ncbi:hypothetical protein BJ944DRAFT_76405 [Cunninghamella echinulata]|nr:hypothetical protein BJ944DRAFT_76405 [Cunninghamella echinulata]